MPTFIKRKIRRTKKDYKIGDVVKIIDFGDCYDTYTDAIIYFGIANNKNVIRHDYFNGRTGYKIEKPEYFSETNWVIINKAIHGTFNDEVIYCLKSAYGDYMISGSTYFIKRNNINTPFVENLKKKNKNFVIRKIPNWLVPSVTTNN